MGQRFWKARISNSEVVAEVRRGQLDVVIWTVSDTPAMTEFPAAGADATVTDVPEYFAGQFRAFDSLDSIGRNSKVPAS